MTITRAYNYVCTLFKLNWCLCPVATQTSGHILYKVTYIYYKETIIMTAKMTAEELYHLTSSAEESKNENRRTSTEDGRIQNFIPTIRAKRIKQQHK